MTAPVGLARVRGAAAASAARQQAADGAELHALRLVAVPALTLVTLDCMPVAIATSVMWRGAGVYSPAVLRPQAQQSRSIPVWSGHSVRHRLSRGGSRQLNVALHRIAITEVRLGGLAKTYLEPRRAVDDTKLRPSEPFAESSATRSSGGCRPIKPAKPRPPLP